jgi:hypothetical protein
VFHIGLFKGETLAYSKARAGVNPAPIYEINCLWSIVPYCRKEQDYVAALPGILIGIAILILVEEKVR